MQPIRPLRLFVTFAVALSLSGCDVLQQVASQNLPLTQEEIVSGLKSALQVGTDTAVTGLSRTDGFYRDAAVRILMPPQAQQIIDKLNSTAAGRTVYQTALQPLVDDLVRSLNRSAEDAAQKAAPIFVGAIRGMTIRDGVNILYGSDTAATSYLRSNTYSQLFETFQPDINRSLDKPLLAGKSANGLYGEFVGSYNRLANNPLNALLGLERINDPSLSSYVTGRALNGVFLKVAREEQLIRQDPLHRVNEVLKRVFGRAAAQPR